MKFSHQLQLNAVPDWIEKYVAYDALKKIIFHLEKERVENPELTEERRHDDEAKFLTALDMQLEKVFDFYIQQETELYARLDELEQVVAAEHSINRSASMGPMRKSVHSPLENLDSTLYLLNEKPSEKPSEKSAPMVEPDLEQPIVRPRRKSTTRISFESRLSRQTTRDSRVYVEQLVDLRSQLISLFVSLSELESYIELNRTAFEKILKKYDKLLDGNLRQQYLPKMVLDSQPFTPKTVNVLRARIEHVEYIYAQALCYGNRQMAIRQMKSHLRDQVAFDRNTVWKDMVGQERRINDAHLKDKTVSTVKLPFSKYHISKGLLRQICCFSLAIVALIVLLNINCFDNRQENYCFALLIFSAIMWATEAIPIYATSFMIPFLIVPLGIMRNPDGTQMAAKAASKVVFQSMFSGTIMMLLGGFALAAALSKYGIAKAFASHVLSRAGTRPRWVLLAIMFVAAFLSMWISNVATPVLCCSLIDPIMRTLSDNSPVARCLLLGIALASCIGGMTSPISSPQNIVTIQYIQPNPGWGKWFAVALPISILSVFVSWGILLLVYRPDRASPHLNTIKPTKGKANWTQLYVVFITILTIALWCSETSMEDHIGDTGIIAAVPLFMFFGTGVLGKDDLNNFLWSVVVLAQGGMALGNAVTSSGLLQDIALRIKDGVQDLEVISILAIFSFLILVFATFVSHTVAALIIVPIVREVGEHLPIPHPNLL
ncbi:low-affinity phosphate transporter, partial [Basidiobolus ranarum]